MPDKVRKYWVRPPFLQIVSDWCVTETTPDTPVAVYLAADVEAVLCENIRLKQQVVDALGDALAAKHALAAKEALIDSLLAKLAHERGCDECWNGKSCGTDCHMNDSQG